MDAGFRWGLLLVAESDAAKWQDHLKSICHASTGKEF
jgi:hypothetical protein